MLKVPKGASEPHRTVRFTYQNRSEEGRMILMNRLSTVLKDAAPMELDWGPSAA